MATLWTKSPDEASFCKRFSGEEKKKLEDIFSIADAQSPWNKALRLLGLSGTGEALIFWHKDVPYFNSSAFAAIVSGGAMAGIPAEGGYSFTLDKNLPKIWALVKCQWKIARFMTRNTGGEDKIAVSLALGLALQSFMLQLGAHVKALPHWLANPASVPPQFRRLVTHIQAVQVRRTALSHAWHEAFPAGGADEPPVDMPAFFWDAPSVATAKPAPGSRTEWTGLPVCGGQVTGKIVTEIENIPAGGPLIFVFRYARPETTEIFAQAAGLVFADGGVLSHACTVAREQNIPAVTGVGAAFFDEVRKNPGAWLSIDGGTGAVKLIQSGQGNDASERPMKES